MRWIEGTLIARTPPKPHANGAEGLWWAEYRVRKATIEESLKVEGCSRKPGTAAYVLEQRYCHERDSEYCTHHPGLWAIWDYGKTPQDAADSCAGDSRYSEAESLHPLHERMLKRLAADRARMARITELRARTHYQQPVWQGTPTWVEIDVVKDEQEKAQAAWEALLRSKRLSKKAAASLIPAETLQALQAPIFTDYIQAVQERKAQHAADMKELEALQRETE